MTLQGKDQRVVDRFESRLERHDRWIKRLIVTIALMLVLGMVVLASSATYALFQGRDINARLCEEAQKNREVIRSILLLSINERVKGAKSERAVDAIYKRAAPYLALVQPIECVGVGDQVPKEE